MDEKDFIQFANGKPDGLKSLFDEYYEALVKYAFMIVRDRSSAKDIAQESIIKLWAKRDQIKFDRFVSYLYVTAKHTAFNYIRDNQKWMDLAEAVERQVAPTSIEDPEAVIQSILETSISSLPKRCKEIFLLGKVQGLTYKEIAQETGLSIKTIERQMGIALKKLREKVLPLQSIINEK